MHVPAERHAYKCAQGQIARPLEMETKIVRVWAGAGDAGDAGTLTPVRSPSPTSVVTMRVG